MINGMYEGSITDLAQTCQMLMLQWRAEIYGLFRDKKVSWDPAGVRKMK